MSAEEIPFEELTPGSLARSANIFCDGCRDLRQLGCDVIDELPPAENLNLAIIVGRFAGFAALCLRDRPVPPAECRPGGCGTIDDSRACMLSELVTMTPEQRAAKVRELASENIL